MPTARNRNATPMFDAWIDGDNVVLCTEAPGVDPENDIIIEVASNGLRIFGAAQPTMPPNVTPLVRTRENLAFNRWFKLPRPVAPENVEAFYRDGLLHVVAKGAAIPMTDEEAEALAASQEGVRHDPPAQDAAAASTGTAVADDRHTYGDPVSPRVLNQPNGGE